MVNTKNMTINERIKLYRAMRMMRQSDIAEKLGIPEKTYSNMERGGKRIPIDRINKIAEILEIPPEYIFIGVDAEEKKQEITAHPVRTEEESPVMVLKQPVIPPPAYRSVYSSEEEQTFNIIHNFLNTQNKKKTFEFVNQLYKEQRGE